MKVGAFMVNKRITFFITVIISASQIATLEAAHKRSLIHPYILEWNRIQKNARHSCSIAYS
jgi:hypothetical protein